MKEHIILPLRDGMDRERLFWFPKRPLKLIKKEEKPSLFSALRGKFQRRGQ